MKGYYTPEKSGEVSEKPTGCLRIEVSNLPEFAELIEQAKKEADQLQKTLNSLSYFDLNIDFEVKEKTKWGKKHGEMHLYFNPVGIGVRNVCDKEKTW